MGWQAAPTLAKPTTLPTHSPCPSRSASGHLPGGGPGAGLLHEIQSPQRLAQHRVIELPPGLDKVQHIVWIIQENHSFDNYFGTYPGADGIPTGTCLPVLPGSTSCVKPFHITATNLPICDLPHEWQVAHAAYDNGRMDGFVWAEGTNYTMG